jgi:hypothetical protein
MKAVAYINQESPCVIEQMPAHRDWMDATFDKHAYQCFPLTMANRLGWSISFKEDIRFTLKSESANNYVDIITENINVSNRRANKTVSIDTGIIFSPEKNISILTMPPPNVFIDGVQCISTIISTSVLSNQLPISLMVTKEDEEIFIPKGTPLASLLPISLSEINNTELIVKNKNPDFMNSQEWHIFNKEKAAVSEEMNSRGEWTHFYRNAIDHNGNKTGEHEVKKITMRVEYE